MDEVAMALSYVVVAAITAVTTFKVNRTRSTVELVAARAGNSLLEQEIRKGQKQTRELVYKELAHVTQDIYEGLGARLDDPEGQERFRRFVRLSTEVNLYGPPSVRAAMKSVNDVYNEFWCALQAERQGHPEKEEAACWQTATRGLKEKFVQTGQNLMTQMNADLTREADAS